MAIIIKTKQALDGCGQVCLRFSLIDGLTSWAVQAAGPVSFNRLTARYWKHRTMCNPSCYGNDDHSLIYAIHYASPIFLELVKPLFLPADLIAGRGSLVGSSTSAR
jgi:hypothetical protein